MKMVSSLCYFIWFMFSTTALACDNEEFGGLVLTPLIKNGNVTLARKLSKVDAEKFQGLESYSGFLTVKEEYESNLFFWYFPHASAEVVPWIIWLQGGPGFSSLFGVFDGIGPLKIKRGKAQLRNVTWASNYSLLFIDNPVGAGYSYTRDERGYPTNEDDVGEQLLEFLIQFLKVFPELRKAPLFLAGESYSGKYLPAFGAYIHRRKSNDTINFRGISIGNGLIDPKSQLTEGHTKLCSFLGLLDDEELVTLRKVQRECVDFIDQGKMIDAANKFNESIEFIKKKSGVNIYNFNRDPKSLPPALESFVTSAAVRELIHVGTAPFDFNNQHVYNVMLPDIMNSTKPFVEELLEHYGVMCYNGQLDVILPYALAKPMHSQFQWSRRKEYIDAHRKRMRTLDTGTVAAYRKSGGNFVEVVIRHAGHMVPAEQPEVCKFVLDTFIEEFK